MLSATLEEGLGDYAIGAKIRTLRLKKKMGLVELGQHSGLIKNALTSSPSRLDSEPARRSAL